MGDIKLLIVDVVEEHVDPAKVVVGKINLLSEESLSDLLLVEYLGKLEEKRPGTARRIIDLVHLVLSDGGDLGQ